jgi:hypothetical protein
MNVKIVNATGDKPDSFACGEDVHKFLMEQGSLPDFLVGLLAFVDKSCEPETVYLFKADDFLEKEEVNE